MRSHKLSCKLHVRAWAILAILAAICPAAVVDRVAVVVGKTVFTQSEVDDEARLTDLEAGKPLDLSAAQRKQAAERLVDQELLREEMKVTGFQVPASGADALAAKFPPAPFPSIAQYRAALARYGVTEDALKARLVWEVYVLRFTDQRFKPFADPADAQTRESRGDGAQPAEDSVDQQMDAWLKQQRADTRIVFKAGGVPMSRARRIVRIVAASVAGLLLVVLVAGIVIVQTQWFRNKVRAPRSWARWKTATGGTAEIGAFAFDWRHLRAQIRDFTIHGLEPAGRRASLSRQPGAGGSETTIAVQGFRRYCVSPARHAAGAVIVYPDGQTNIPAPKVQAKSSSKTGS